jgi:RNA polymerase primary sigma factor
VRLPLNKVGLTNRISRAFSQLEQEFEREPTPEELANLLDIDVEEVSATLGMAVRHVSMDQPMSEGEDSSTLMDVMFNKDALATDDALAVKASLHTEIERSLSTLTERQKEVIRYFFGLGIDHPLSLEDIGERFSLTRERVRQIKDKAITKLRTTSRCKLLRGFLGT